MGKVLDIVNEKVVPVIEAAGYEVVETQYVKEYGEMNLVFLIHKNGGVSLDDCEKVNNILDPVLEEVDPTNNEPYVLVVSSPGLDRPIKTDRDYARNMGVEVEVKLYSGINKKKVFVGTLVNKTDSSITLKRNSGEMEFELRNVALVKPYVSFKALNLDKISVLEGDEENE